MNPIAAPILALLLLGQAAPTAEVVRVADPPPREVKAGFLKLLDRPRVALDVIAGATEHEPEGLVSERLTFASEKKADGSAERVPVLVIRPEAGAGKRPAVIVHHGTGGTKEGQKSWLVDLARRGIVGVAIDARYHGDRAGGLKGREAYVEAITRAWRAKPGEAQEHPFYFDTCWDIWRTVDYLQTRTDVDPDRIGMLGTSMGGIETWLAAAVDDRVKVAVPAIGVQSFRWSLENGHWQGRARTISAAHEAAAKDLGKAEVDAEVCRALWEKVIPGMLGPYDGPSMIRLFADRPLLILNGELDPNCPLGGAELAFDAAEDAYRRADAGDHLQILVAPGVGHAVTAGQRQAALDWFVRWLAP